MELEIKQGDKFLCINTVRLNGNGAVRYSQGKVYTSERSGCITDERGNKYHGWDGDKEPFKKHFTKITDQSFNIWN